jgi:hypothetical protein
MCRLINCRPYPLTGLSQDGGWI